MEGRGGFAFGAGGGEGGEENWVARLGGRDQDQILSLHLELSPCFNSYLAPILLDTALFLDYTLRLKFFDGFGNKALHHHLAIIINYIVTRINTITIGLLLLPTTLPLPSLPFQMLQLVLLVLVIALSQQDLQGYCDRLIQLLTLFLTVHFVVVVLELQHLVFWEGGVAVLADEGD